MGTFDVEIDEIHGRNILLLTPGELREPEDDPCQLTQAISSVAIHIIQRTCIQHAQGCK